MTCRDMMICVLVMGKNTFGKKHFKNLVDMSRYRVDLLRQTPLEILQMSWCNTLQLLTMVKAQHNCLVSVNCWPLSYLKAGKSRSDCPCQKRHNTSHPKQNFWPFRLKFWYVVLHMEPYKNYFLAVPWEQYWTPALTLTWFREGQKVWKWFQRHIWDKNFVILKSEPIWVTREVFGK